MFLWLLDRLQIMYYELVILLCSLYITKSIFADLLITCLLVNSGAAPNYKINIMTRISLMICNISPVDMMLTFYKTHQI